MEYIKIRISEYERISTQTADVRGSVWTVCYVSKYGSWWNGEFIGCVLIGACGEQQHFVKGRVEIYK